MWENLADAAPDASSPVPAYHQVYSALREQLAAPTVPAGAKLPTERVLAESLGISRATLRQALRRLEDDGVIVRRQGDGTFVAEKDEPERPSDLQGFAAEFAGQGQVTSRVLRLQIATPPADVAAALGLESDADSAIEVRRVRSLDGAPLSLESVWLSASRCAGLLDVDLTQTSLYAALRALGVQPARAEETVTVTSLDDEAASLLEQVPGAGALLVERLTFDRDDQCVECVRTLLRSDRVAVRTLLEGAPGSAMQARSTAFSLRPPPGAAAI